MEYTIPDTGNKRILIVTDIHYCEKIWHGLDQESRADLLIEALNDAFIQTPYDGILCLGDYSLDFWAWHEGGSFLHHPPVSNTQNFVQKVVPRFPMSPYMIPGNHEQYGQGKWKEITGFPRQFSVVYGNYVFLMCDTFSGDLDPTENSDGCYTGIDPEFLAKSLDRYQDKTIILCMHDLMTDRESLQVKDLIVSHPQILCAFAGHIHKNKTVILGKDFGNLPLIYCGDFSYSEYSFPNRGYELLDFHDGFSARYHKCV